MAFSLGGTSVFGTPATTATPTFGFGSATASTANRPAFGQTGFSFGQSASTTPSFNLGGTTTTSSGFGFGGLTSSTPSTGFGFGTSGFGSTQTTSAPSGFGTFGGFGGTTTTAAPAFGFGTQPTTNTSLFSGFGQTQTTAGSTGFGGFGGFGTKPLGTGTTQSGFSFGQSPFGGGVLGGTSTFGTSGFGQTQQPQQPGIAGLQAPNALDAFYNSVFNCNIFGDERDQILAKWNLLQALWGVGKGYYSLTAPPVEYTPQNPLCRFKAIGYSCKPTAQPKDGLVAVCFNKKDQDIRSQESQLIASLNNVLGNRPNLVVTVDSIKPLSESKSQVLFYVQEKGANGVVRRIPNSELAAFLLQPMQKQSLTNMGAENVYPYSAPDSEQMKEYLENPPAGIDMRLWKQAQLDNPDPEKLIPVPIIGFSEVRWRVRCQENETKVHQSVLDRIAEDIADIKRRNSDTIAKITEYKQRILEFEHRILKVLVKQEVSRNVGLALRPEEEGLRSQLEALQSQINTPLQFKGRLNELLAQMRLQRQEAVQHQTERYAMDPSMQEEVYQYLSEQHNALSKVVQTVNSDLNDLKVMSEDMSTLMRKTHS